MRLPISPPGAAVGVILLIACSGAGVTAGVVAPPASDPAFKASEPSPAAPEPFPERLMVTSVPSALPPSAANEAQPFWYPGVDDGTTANVSLSSVPVRGSAPEAAGAILLGTEQHPLIPLPASAWTGMAGLLGLGAVKLLRNFRKMLA